MYWYVAIYSEECFWTQYMYPKLSPFNRHRWCPLGKLSHLSLEQLRCDYYGNQYIHGMMFNNDGNLSNSLPHYHLIFNTSKNDSDTTTLPESTAVIHKEEFKEAMNKDIVSLNEVKHWNLMVRNNIPEGLNLLPSTWAFDIKRYPNGIFCKLKAIFFASLYFQREGVNYTEPYSPVVG